MLTTKFQQFPLPADMLVNLEHLKFLEPTPVQAGVLPLALAGRDILATAQTGTGKTAAFGIPMLAKIYTEPDHRAVILVPTRELGAQIFKVLRQLSSKMNITGSLVVGGESFNRQADEMMRGVDYIVATPGRLNDHLEEGTISLAEVTFLVLDEVDRMLDMGFLPQIKEIIKHIPVKRQTLLFSATLPKNMMGLAANLQTNAERVEIGHHSKPAEHVQQTTIQTTMEGKNALVLKELALREGRVLIFTRTKARTERLARFLSREGLTVVALHGDKMQSQRKMAMEAFRSGRARILVATDIAGRGIDVPDIEHVINYDVPMTREDYIHRIGRTGRIGKLGSAVTFLSPGDREGQMIVTGIDPRKAAKQGGHPAQRNQHAKPHGKPYGQRPQQGPGRPGKFSKFAHGPKAFGGKKPFGGPKPFPRSEPRDTEFDAPSFEQPIMGVVPPRPQQESAPKPFEKKFFGKKPFDGERSFGGPKRFGKKPFGKKPFDGERSFDGPKRFGKKPFGNKPFDGERSFDGPKPFGKKPFGRKPFDGERSFDGPKPFGKKPFGRKPFDGERSFDGPKSPRSPFGKKPPFKQFGGQKREDGFTGWRAEGVGRQERPGGHFQHRKPRFGGPRPAGGPGRPAHPRAR